MSASDAELAQLKAIATDAQERLTDADPPTQRRVYELLQLDTCVRPDRSLDIHGNIPTDRSLTIDSEMPAEVPRDP